MFALKWWRSCFWCLLLLVLLFAIVPQEPHSRLLQDVSVVANIGGEHIANMDKIRHFFAFTVLALLFDLAYFIQILKKIVLLIIYGGFIEIVQYFLPYRECSFSDFVFDILFILLYYFVTRVLFQHFFAKIYKTYQRMAVG